MPVELRLVGSGWLHLRNSSCRSEGVIVVEVDTEAGEMRLRVGKVPTFSVRFKDPATIRCEDGTKGVRARDTDHGCKGARDAGHDLRGVVVDEKHARNRLLLRGTERVANRLSRICGVLPSAVVVGATPPNCMRS